VALNRAVAIGRAFGATRGLAALGAIAHDERLQDYQPYWAARADLMLRAGRAGEARSAFERALGLTSDPAVRSYLGSRLRSAAEAAAR
jgi:RNA polymerase sigma-70 factor (ECF subfamily)